MQFNAKVRKLKVEVSLDDDGYPRMLDNPMECASSVKDLAIDGAPASGSSQDQDLAIDEHLLLEAIMCKNFEALPKNAPIYSTKRKKQTTLQEEQVPKPKAKKAKNRNLHLHLRMLRQLHQVHQQVHLMAPS